MDFWKDAFIPVVAAAIGTGVGASVAFFIERGKQAKVLEDEHVTATNIALFALFRIMNDLTGYKRQHIDPHRGDPDRWYTLPPSKLPEPTKFDPASLSYLFEMPGDAPSLPMAVYVGLGMYEAVYENAMARYQIHMHEVQPALERAQRTVEGNYPLKHLVNTILGGPRVTETLQSATDQLIELIDLTLEYIPTRAEWLRDVAKKKYRKRQIVRLLMH